jgi:hypothetical protein
MTEGRAGSEGRPWGVGVEVVRVRHATVRLRQTSGSDRHHDAKEKDGREGAGNPHDGREEVAVSYECGLLSARRERVSVEEKNERQ